MKIVGMFLTLLMAINSMAFAHMDLCHISTVSCSQTSVDECPGTSSDHGQSQRKNHVSHGHCKVHCSQRVVYFNSIAVVVFLTSVSEVITRYLFSFDEVFLVGPFRPPIV